MRVALVFGVAQGNALSPRLCQIRDGLDIDCFDTVVEFLDRTMKRGITYDRLLLLSNKMDDMIIRDLYQYWSDYSRNTGVVLLGKAGDVPLLQKFMDVFQTQQAGVVIMQTTSLQLLGSCITDSVVSLNAKYGIKDDNAIQVEEDSVEIAKPEPKAAPPKEKRTLMGALFGSGKKKEKKTKTEAASAPAHVAAPAEAPAVIETPAVSEAPAAGGTYVPDWEDAVTEEDMMGAPIESPRVASPVFGEPFGSMDEESEPVVQSEVQPDVPKWQQMAERQKPSEQSPIQPVVQPEPAVQPEVQPDVPKWQQMAERQKPSEQSEVQQETVEQIPSEVQKPVKPERRKLSFGRKEKPQVDEPNGVASVPMELQVPDDAYTPDEPIFGEPFKEEPTHQESVKTIMSQTDLMRLGNRKNEQQADIVEDIAIESPVVEVSVSPRKQDVALVEDDEAISIGDAEANYRQSVEPKTQVVTKTVVKEVTVKSSVLGDIKSGRRKKTVIVTGDRGTGITTTALSLAKVLSKFTDVLYFDCDLRTHGLLNYIDYGEFAAYNNIQLNGVKMCRNAKALDNCIVPIASGLHLLTTDFTCDCTPDELIIAQEAVAERQTDFGVVVVDCPMDMLDSIREIALTADALFCVEASKRGFMNALCLLEECRLPVRYKKSLVSRGKILATKCPKDLDLKRLVGHINTFFEPGDVEWMSMPISRFDGRLDESVINGLLS